MSNRMSVVGPTFTFPPLPVIQNKDIWCQIFTHRSLYARPTHIFEDYVTDLSPDNERYEHLGDSVLGMVITDLTLRLYPGLRVGSCTKMRAIVVGNNTLAEISQGYKLIDRLMVHPAQSVTLRQSANVQADVFEAFVGGLYTDQGIDAVRSWLAQLFAPYIQNAYNRVRGEYGLTPINSQPAHPFGVFQNMSPTLMQSPSHKEMSEDKPVKVQRFKEDHDVKPPPASPPADVDKTNIVTFGSPYRPESHSTTGHLALFNQHLQKESRTVEWHYWDGEGKDIGTDPRSGGATPFGGDAEHVAKDLGIKQLLDVLPTMCGTKTTPVWTVSVYVDGEYSGAGQGNTKKAARNEAAKFGLKRLGILPEE